VSWLTTRRGAGFAVAAASVAVVAVVSLTVAGCSSPAPKPSPSKSSGASSTHSASPTATPTPTPAAKFYPNGNAEKNLPYFNAIGHRLLDNNAAANSNGRVIVDYFVAAGFPKDKMEVTPDKTSIGLNAWNIEFSVNMNGTCLIGQAGNVGFQSFATTLLDTKTCLIGTTRPIDW
jgi:hypothetical protein